MLHGLSQEKDADPDGLIRLDEEMQRQSFVVIQVPLAPAVRFIAE